MTERFIDAVRKCVEDGKLTTEEKELLMKLAKEEGINEIDAEIYVIGELKKKNNEEEERKSKKEKPKSDHSDTYKKLGDIITTVTPIVIAIITLIGGKKGK